MAFPLDGGQPSLLGNRRFGVALLLFDYPRDRRPSRPSTIASYVVHISY
jgi:hypothetical protein